MKKQNDIDLAFDAFWMVLLFLFFGSITVYIVYKFVEALWEWA